jgi:hypothetical protein
LHVSYTQLENSKSHFSTNIVLSKYDGGKKQLGTKNKNQLIEVRSELLLMVSNYRFVKAQQNKPATPCHQNECTVSIKLSSTGFTFGDVPEDGKLKFDRQGAVFSYNSFVDLLASGHICEDFLKEVRRLYEADEGALQFAYETFEFANDEIFAELNDTVIDSVGESDINLRALLDSSPGIYPSGKPESVNAQNQEKESSDNLKTAGKPGTSGSKRRGGPSPSTSSSGASTATKKPHATKK